MRARSYRWVILVVGTLAYATSQFARQNYTGIQKFIAADLQLDKVALGLLGSVFFYSYALFQMPWGIASDRLGSRWVTGLGILLMAGAMFGFAAGQTERSLLLWRTMSGVGAAAVYVAMAGGLARWFPPSERGFSQTVLGGVGGGLGESTAFFLLPVISIYFSSGWRQGTSLMGVAIAAMGVLCLIFLRPAPAEAHPMSRPASFDWRLLRDPQLWCYTFLFSAFIVAIRVVQPWIPVYAADVYIVRFGLDVNAAVIGGGTVVIVAYSLLGRGVGCPLAGKLSDWLLARGISRPLVAMAWLLASMLLLLLLASEPTSTWALAVVVCLLGMSINLFPLISAAVSETYGPGTTGSVVSFINSVAQILGATALGMSGYVGVSMSAQAGHGLDEYRGVWMTALVSVGIATLLGASLHVATSRRLLAKVGRS